MELQKMDREPGAVEDKIIPLMRDAKQSSVPKIAQMVHIVPPARMAELLRRCEAADMLKLLELLLAPGARRQVVQDTIAPPLLLNLLTMLGEFLASALELGPDFRLVPRSLGHGNVVINTLF